MMMGRMGKVALGGMGVWIDEGYSCVSTDVTGTLCSEQYFFSCNVPAFASHVLWCVHLRMKYISLVLVRMLRA